MKSKNATEEAKTTAFNLYLQQYPNVNLTTIANEVGRDRSRVSRWASEGEWLAMAERLQEKPAPAVDLDTTDAQGEDYAKQLAGAASFDDVITMMGSRAKSFLESGFKFTSPGQLIRFMELSDKHEEKRRKLNLDSGSDDPLSDSSLPDQEADAIRAGKLLIKYSQRPQSDG